MSAPPRLVLASASPRRRELLTAITPDFDVVPSDVDERLERGPLTDAVARLALRKARAIADARGSGLILAADTIVVVDGEALGKPADAAEARAMLRQLRGRTHEVMTGIAVVDSTSRRQATDTVVSRVTMRDYSDGEIADYVAGGEPLDKAGAYAIQGAGGALVAALEGSRSNVIGLPLAATAALLRRLGASVSAPPEP